MAAPGEDGTSTDEANTNKGHGSKTMTTEMFAWHRRSPSHEELEMLLEELHAG